MGAEGGKRSNVAESARRIVAMVAVISCHLGLLMQLLRPISNGLEKTSVVESGSPALELRLIAAVPSRHPARASLRLTGSTLRLPHAPSGKATEPPLAPRVAQVAAPMPEVRPASTSTTAAGYVNIKMSTNDGGFQERLHDAREAHAVRGVPGSDTSFAPGIHLANPMSQGVGAVMRNTQRLFGVSNSHCIDVDVWRHLSPQELSARHISLRDIANVDEKYNCSQPMGLSF